MNDDISKTSFFGIIFEKKSFSSLGKCYFCNKKSDTWCSEFNKFTDEFINIFSTDSSHSEQNSFYGLGFINVEKNKCVVPSDGKLPKKLEEYIKDIEDIEEEYPIFDIENEYMLIPFKEDIIDEDVLPLIIDGVKKTVMNYMHQQYKMFIEWKKNEKNIIKYCKTMNIKYELPSFNTLYLTKR